MQTHTPTFTQVVLLDHGLYHTVPDGMRRDLCKLLLASVSPFSTRRRREALARRFAGPLFKFFPPILSPWFVFSSRLTSGDLYAAAKQQLPQNVSMKDVGECLVALHDAQGEGGNMLGVLHSLGYTRGLLNALHFPERKRLQSMIKYAILGLLADDMRAKALREGTRALPLTTRAQLLAGDAYVYLLWLLIPVLVLMGPFLFLYEIWRAVVFFFWRLGGLNPLAWED